MVAVAFLLLLASAAAQQYNADHLTSAMPANLKALYLKNGESLADWVISGDAAPPSGALQWNAAAIRTEVQSIQSRGDAFLKTLPYEDTNVWMQQALNAHKASVVGKNGVVVGSQQPNYEAIVLANNPASVTTVEFRNINCPGCEQNKMKILTVDQYKAMPQKPMFDFAMSVCAINHAGLGRYGDPLDPDGDIKSMQEMLQMVKPGGLLFIALPIGIDTVVWNAHRIYGQKRIKQVFQGWEQIGTFGVNPGDWNRPPHTATDGRPVHHHLPSVFVLKKPASADLEINSMMALNEDLRSLQAELVEA